MANDLQTKLDAILTDKNTNLLPENLKAGVTCLGVEGTLTQGEDLQEQLDNQDLIIRQLQEELSNKAIYDCNYYNAKLVPTNGKITDYITEISTQLNTSKVTDMSYMFQSCTNLTTIPLLDTSKVTNMFDMFYGCTSLTTIPLLNTSSVTTMSYMFRNCTNLTTIPLLNTSKVANIQNIFDGCTSLSDESLNNILAMCTNAVKITNSSYKTLKYIGLTSTQANKCKTLSNYSAFTSAGWTTGY